MKQRISFIVIVLYSTYNSQHNNNNNLVLGMTMPYSGQG